MKMLQDLKEQIPELTTDQIQISELPSKKNSVINLKFDKKPSKLPQEVIVKIFRTENIAIEYNILTRLWNQGFHVPSILFFHNPYLFLEKVDGTNLCDFINERLKGTKHLDDLNLKQELKLLIV